MKAKLRFRGGFLTAIAVLMATEYVESQPLHEDSADLAVVNVNVVPMDQERVLERHTVLIKDDLITWLGPVDSIELPAALNQEPECPAGPCRDGGSVHQKGSRVEHWLFVHGLTTPSTPA